MSFNDIELRLSAVDVSGRPRAFRLGQPQPVSREVEFRPDARSTNAFHLPRISSTTFCYQQQFIGDVARGGACNVDVLDYVPHGLTHLETSSHILAQDDEAVSVKDIPSSYLSGLVYLVDLTHLDAGTGQLIGWQDLQPELEKITLPVRLLAFKTRASLLPMDYDFSGRDFLSLDPEAARRIHDLSLGIKCLILDLPSIDREHDGGRLHSHRNYFGLPESGYEAEDSEKRVLVELAWFSELEAGYYYAVLTPQRFQVNAVSTGIFFYPLEEIASGGPAGGQTFEKV